MDDRRAHFLTTVGDACTAAGLANISVELTLANGTRAVGIPSPRPAEPDGDGLDQTGYADRLLIDGRAVELHEVVQLSIHRP